MGVIILAILIYSTCLRVSYSDRSQLNFVDHEECEFGGVPGNCRELPNCPRLFRLLIQSRGRSRPKFLDFLRSLHCGFSGKEPIVCCPESYSRRIHFYSHVSKNPERNKISPRYCGKVNVNDKIFGGGEADLFDFPWMALIGYDTAQGLQYRCGGTLISRRYVLTAAHCLTNLKSLTLKSVRLGEHDLSSDVDCSAESGCAPPARDFPIKRFIPHPEFRLKDLRNDIALIELAGDVNYSKSMLPVCLPVEASQKRRILDGEMVTIAGWGATENGTYSSVLRKAEIQVMPYKHCRVTYDGVLFVTEFQICAGGKGSVDSCNGDSGGPLKIIEMNAHNEPVYVQYGLVSFGPRICGTLGKPGVYTRITPYIDWILNEMR